MTRFDDLDDDLNDDLFSGRAVADPYTHLGQLRRLDPVHWSDQLQSWLVTRYDDVAAVSRQPQLFSSAIMADDGRPAIPPIAKEDEEEFASVKAMLRERLTQTDPPAHRGQRAAFQPYFAASTTERWRPLIRAACTQLLDAVGDRHEMDVMRDLAVPLPLNVISTLLDVPIEDRRWVRAVAERLLIGPRPGTNRIRELSDAMQRMYGYIEPLAEERRAAPGDDLISLIMGVEADGLFTRTQALQNIVLLVVAGHETTINLICNGVLAFARHPEQWDRLRADPDRWASPAVEECLRYDPPVKSIERVATKDVEVRGKRIRAGDRVRWFISSANRDPERFADPDSFDISRTSNAHLSFGHGIHLCLGATLARMEGQEVLKALARRCDRLKLAMDEVEYVPAVDLRSLKALAIRW